MTAATATAHTPAEVLESRTRDVGWGMALRGVIAVIFGIIALRYPSAAASAFVVIFAVYAFADGIIDFVTAHTFGKMGMRWGWYAFAGLVSIAAGVVALAYPSLTFAVLVLLVGARAFTIGCVELGAAISWRELDSRWLLGLTGVLSIVFGILLFVSPAQGGLALLWTIGVYAIIFGVALFALGLRLVGQGGHGLMRHATPA